jgi:sugar phosphate isomerase/epimerase
MTHPAKHSLGCYVNLGSLDKSSRTSDASFHAIREAGYDGVQFGDFPHPDRVHAAQTLGLGVCGSGRVNAPAEASPLAQKAVDSGFECLTVHVGWGMEDNLEVDQLAASVIEASRQHRIPLYVETHRATILQDIWRAVQLVKRFPELEINCDFSHWYTGLEMVYGGFEKKVEFIRPVIDRMGFIHARIGNPGCIQVDIGDGDSATRPYVGHFCTVWTQVFAAYLSKPATHRFCFATELLGPEIYYARVFNGKEESNRWEQALVLVKLARECFRKAQHQAQTAVR